MIRFAALTLGLALAAGSAHAQFGGPPNLDKDGDGKVTWAEFKSGNGARMARMDANKDGKVSKAEFLSMVDKIKIFAGAEAAERMTQRWPQMDANGDSALSAAELEALDKRRFERADSNSDGWLSKGEILSMRQNGRGGG